jgi:hypothetical protein
MVSSSISTNCFTGVRRRERDWSMYLGIFSSRFMIARIRCPSGA